MIVKTLLTLPSLSHKCAVEFSRDFMMCDDVIALAANEVCMYISYVFQNVLKK